MESLSILNVIYRVAKEIAKAASRARQCKRRCQGLACRVEVIAELVRECEAAPNDSATRTRVLDRLKDELEEALEVVQSCRSFWKLLLACGSTSSSIDNAERKINNCLLELGVANDVRLVGLRSQSQQTTTAAGQLNVRDGVVPRTINVVNNSGIVNDVKAIFSFVRSKNTSSMHTNISAGGSVNYYYGDSSSRNGTKEDGVAAIANNSGRVSVPAGGSSGQVSDGDDFNYNARKQDVTTMPMRGKRWDDKNGQATAGERNREAAAAAGPQMPSTPWPAASHMYPYGGTGDHGAVPYYNHHSAEEDPNSCSIM